VRTCIGKSGRRQCFGSGATWNLGKRPQEGLRPAAGPLPAHGAGILTDCPTLQEAVLAWQRLAPEQKIRATVKVISGPVYRAHEIERLHYGPKPA